MITAQHVAHYFLSKLDLEAGDTMSPLKLQKLIYYAQAYHLAAYGEALFHERIEAWVDGPVVRNIYDAYRDIPRYASIPMSQAVAQPGVFVGQSLDLLEEINEIYGNLSGKRLRDLTHAEQPWQKARDGYEPYQRCDAEIKHEWMQAFYKTKLAKEGLG